MRYVAFIHADDAPGFGISFPDFPGCVTQGGTMEEALARAREVLAFHVSAMLEDGIEIPAPRSIDEIEADTSLSGWREGATLALVPLDPGRAARDAIAIPADQDDAEDGEVTIEALEGGLKARRARKALAAAEDAIDIALALEARAEDEGKPSMPAELVKATLDGRLHPLAAWRKTVGLTQGQLAEKAGVRMATISDIEQGRIDPRQSTLVALAAALGVDLDDIVD